MFDQKVKSAKLFKEIDMYYLDLRYVVEDDKEIREYHIPKVRIPLEISSLIVDNYGSYEESANKCSNVYIKLPSERLLCFMGEATFPHALTDPIPDVLYAKRIIKDKTAPVEMTMDEIEKQLGHKVKIINKGE